MKAKRKRDRRKCKYFRAREKWCARVWWDWGWWIHSAPCKGACGEYQEKGGEG